MEGVHAKLGKNKVGLIRFHQGWNNGREPLLVDSVICARKKREVHRIASSFALANLMLKPGSRKKKSAALVQGNSEDLVSAVECRLHPVSMMHINVNVDHAIAFGHQFDNGNHRIVHIAKPRGPAAHGVVKAAGNMKGYLDFSSFNQTGRLQGAACA